MIDIVYADYEGNDSKVRLSAKQIKEMRSLVWKITFSKKKFCIRLQFVEGMHMLKERAKEYYNQNYS